MQWNLEQDQFTYEVYLPDKPFTRSGILSVAHSVYDPVGFAVVMGKHMIVDAPFQWDDPLPESVSICWSKWKD